MSVVPSIVLVDLASNEKHCIISPECIVGRHWLKCDDLRISRNHGILKVLSKTLISVQATHENSIFFRKKNDARISQIKQNQDVNLSVGDSFGLLVDKFWFCVQLFDTNQNKMDVNAINLGTDDNSEVQMNGGTNKRPTNSDLEPDSTNKKVKTEPAEFQWNGDERAVGASNDNTTLIMTNGGGPSNPAANIIDENATNNQMPSTSSTSANNDSVDIPSAICPHHHGHNIKTEPIDMHENEAQPMQVATEEEVAIKIEHDGEHSCIHCSCNKPIKTEIKEEPTNDDDSTAVASNNIQAIAPSSNPVVASTNDQQTVTQAPQPARRECCRYGIRCYRRNPAHKAEQAHPGDIDYRLPDYPNPPLGAPSCPFLDRCYRRNPLHFQQFSHRTNYKNKDGFEASAKEPKQKTPNQPNNADSDDEEDPYATDGDSDPDYAGDSE